MDQLHVGLGIVLGFSFLFNLIIAADAKDARARATFWRMHAERETKALLDMIHQHHNFRLISHRRDPKTGRIKPRGE